SGEPARAAGETRANAVSAVHVALVKSRCENTRPARTNRFFTHCRGRIDTTIAVSIALRDPPARWRGGGDAGTGWEGSRRPRGTRAPLVCGWAPSGHVRSAA